VKYEVKSIDMLVSKLYENILLPLVIYNTSHLSDNGLFVAVGVGVGVLVDFGVLAGVLVCVDVGVTVGVLVCVEVTVGVGVGVEHPPPTQGPDCTTSTYEDAVNELKDIHKGKEELL
jgi:hypothetical protein